MLHFLLNECIFADIYNNLNKPDGKKVPKLLSKIKQLWENLKNDLTIL